MHSNFAEFSLGAASEILTRNRVGFQLHTGLSSRIIGVAEFPPGAKEHLSFWNSPDLAEASIIDFQGVLLVAQGTEIDFRKSNGTFLTVENPRLAYAWILQELISNSTHLNEPTAEIDLGYYIHPSAVVEAGAAVGKNCVIGPNVYISANTVIGSGVRIGPNSSIGSEGFGFVRDNQGSWIEIPQVGKVVIGDNVRIGSNVCIDRAAISETRLGDGVKIDNHVHIAHNCEIGPNTVITAGVEISGSVKVGKHVWIGPQTSILEKISIGDVSFIGIGSVVIRNVPNSARVAGNPARTLPSRS